MPIHLGEHGAEPFPPLAVEVADRAAQLGDGGPQLVALAGDGVDARLDLPGLDLGAQIDRPDALARAAARERRLVSCP